MSVVPSEPSDSPSPSVSGFNGFVPLVASSVSLIPSLSTSSLFRGSIVIVNSAESVLPEISEAWMSKTYCCFSKYTGEELNFNFPVVESKLNAALSFPLSIVYVVISW